MKDVRDFLAFTPRIVLGVVLLNLVVLTASAHANLGQTVNVSVPPPPSARSNAAPEPELGGTESTIRAFASAEPTVTTEPAANGPEEGSGPVPGGSPDDRPLDDVPDYVDGTAGPEPTAPGGKLDADVSGKLLLESHAAPRSRDKVGVLDPGDRGDRTSAATRRESSKGPRRRREHSEGSAPTGRAREVAATRLEPAVREQRLPAIVALALGVTLAAVGAGTRSRS